MIRHIVALTLAIAALAGQTGASRGGEALSFSLGTVSVRDLRARHVAGQTFLTWREDGVPAFDDVPTIDTVLKARSEIARTGGLRFRVYRSRTPITSIAGLAPVAEVGPLSCWNTDFSGISPTPSTLAVRYVTEEGASPVPDRTGLYVTNPVVPGAAYYAVTPVLKGHENGRLGPDNSLQVAVDEIVGRGEPVLQSTDRPATFLYVERPTLHHYVRWESPPNFSIEGKAFDYLVGIPANMPKPAPVGLHLHCWGGSMKRGYGWWYDAGHGSMLVASNDVPYDWWTGFHERLMTARPPTTGGEWGRGLVRPFTQTRLLSFLDWVATRWDIDRDRAFVAGSSMGGSGAVAMAVHHPDRFAWAIAWVPVLRPYYSPGFRSSYERVYGRREFGARMEAGSTPWDYFDAVSYLREHPAADTPFISFASGKNDAGIGWQQAVDFLRVLQKTRRPHVFRWGQGGHGERADTPGGGDRESMVQIRAGRSVPAFTRCSLDDDPGDGIPEHGVPTGQVNRYLTWDPDEVIDTLTSWEMTVRLTASSPRSTCLVDVTPRRLHTFKPKPGERFQWSNSTNRGKVVQAGVVTADESGVVTVPQIEVGRSGNRVRLDRAADLTRDRLPNAVAKPRMN